MHRLYKDNNIYFKLFEAYYDNGLVGHAIELLAEKADIIPYRKIFKIFNDSEILTEKHFTAFKNIFRRIDKLVNEGEIHQKLSSYEVLRKEVSVVEVCTEGFKLKKDMA